jgi:mannose-6-phosphate isomerase-like protein (cupin superfamily)
MWLTRKGEVAAFDFEGLKIRDLTQTNLRSGSVAEIEVPSRRGHRPSRSRRSDKFYVCTDGALAFQVGSRQLVLASGDLLVIERNEWFAYSNEGDKPARLFLIHVPPFELEHEEFADEMPGA